MRKFSYMPAALIAAVIISVFSGCGSPLVPFDPTVVSRVKDETAPIITILTPETDSDFGQTVTVTGRTSDDGEVMPVLSYTVSDSLGSMSKTGEIDITPLEAESGVAGIFSFTFTTTEFSTDILLTVKGSDWNNNEVTPVTVRLVYPGSAISSFEAVPGNKSISLSWDEVSGADNYELFYTSKGSYPSEQYGQTISGLNTSYTEAEPFVLDNLVNGEIYTFILKASSGSTEWSSDYQQAVPLSPLSLKPVITSYYDSLQLDWQYMSPGLGYQVYRSTGGSSAYVNISGTISATTFTDNNVNAGTEYSYKILPSVEGSIFSEASSASTAAFSYASTHFASQKNTAAGTSDLDILGSSAFLAQGTAGIQRLNISNKSYPTLITPETWTDCNVRAVDAVSEILSTYAFVADYNRGMQIYSYNKGTYGTLGLCPTSHPDNKINDVVYSDYGTNYVYAAWPLDMGSGYGGIDKMSVSDLNSPSVSDTYLRSDADYYKVAVSSDGNYLFAVYIDPWTPYFGMDIIQTSTMDRVYPSGDGLPAMDVALSGDYAYVVDGTWLTIYDVSSPSSPSELGKCVVPGDAREIDVEGDFAYVTENGSGLRTINISDPANPVLVDFYSKESISGIDVSDGYAYLSGSDSAFTILNIGEQFELQQSVLHPVAEEANVLAQSGDYLLVGTYDGNINTDDILKVIDVSEPASPTDICSFTPVGTVRGIQFSDDYLYLTVSEYLGSEALQIVEFSNLSAGWTPQSFSYELSEDVGGLAVVGDYAYIANSSDGFTIVDISDPENPDWPVFTSTVSTTGEITDCVVNENRLYLLTSLIGVQVYDITSPASPEFLGLYATSGSAADMEIQGNWAFIADWSEGLKMIDLSDPNPSNWEPAVYDYKLPNNDSWGLYTMDVEVKGNFACITYYDGVLPYDDAAPGVAVIGVADPASPHLVGTMDIQGEYNNDVLIDGEYIYIAVDADGLEIIEMSYKE